MAIRIAAVVVGLLIVGGVLGLLASSGPLSTAVPAGPEHNTSPAALTPTQASSSQGDLLTRHGLVVPRATASFDAHEVGSPSVSANHRGRLSSWTMRSFWPRRSKP